MQIDISNQMRDEIVEIIYDAIEEVNEVYGYENKLPDLKNYTTIMLMNYYHTMVSMLP